MVPGLQVLLWGGQGPAELAIEVEGSVELAQAWGGVPLELDHRDDQIRLRCQAPLPLCGFAITTGAPTWVRPLAGPTPWLQHPTEGRLATDALAPPPHILPGQAALFWNPPRDRTVQAHQETVSKLKALGYLR
jgi:hypothetical protein